MKSAAKRRLFALDPLCAGSDEACALSQIWQIVETDSMWPMVRTSVRRDVHASSTRSLSCGGETLHLPLSSLYIHCCLKFSTFIASIIPSAYSTIIIQNSLVAKSWISASIHHSSFGTCYSAHHRSHSDSPAYSPTGWLFATAAGRMFLKHLDLTTALRPLYLPDEVLLFVQDNVGLYEG